MLSYLKLGLIALAAVIVSFGAGFVYGVKHQKSVVATQVANETITILKEGREVDEKVFDADDSALCTLLGGC